MKSVSLLFLLLFTSLVISQVPAYVPVSGLQGYWPFSGNGNDASINSGDLTNHGAVLTTDRFGTTNSAYSFNGSSQYLDDQSPEFIFGDTSDFTISFWMTRTSVGGGIALMNGSSASGNFIWLVSSSGSGSNMVYGTNKQQSAWTFINGAYTTSSWEHVVCTYQSGSMILYINNTLMATGTLNHANVTAATLPFYIGRGIGGSYFNVSIDDIGIWDRVLTACERTDLYNSSQTLTSVSAGPDSTVCANSAFVLSGAGANTYVWNNGVTDGVSFNPINTQVYTVTGFDAAGCSGWDQITITTTPSQIDAGMDQTICLGSTAILNGSGGSNYTWDNGVTDGVPFIPSTSIYTLTGLGTNGCIGTDQVEISSYLPLINAGPSNVNVCDGNSIILYGSGGSTYTWDNNVQDSVAFFPSTSALYTVTGTDTAGCSNTDQIQVNVIPLPIVDAGVDITICEGETVTLTGSGANGYSWDNSVVNGVPFSPSTTTTYTVIGNDANNCQATDDVTVIVNLNTSSTIDASGIDQYILNGEIFTTSGTYSQTLTNSDGCDSIITLNLSFGFTSVDDNYLFLVSIYPNPASSILNIELMETGNKAELIVFANDGRIVRKAKLNNQVNSIDISELANGNYVATILDLEGKQKQFMFVKK